MERNSSNQRTGLVICASASFLASSPEATRFPETLEKTGSCGSLN
jgi:hypothetical protein